METLFVFLLKASSGIALFYLVYWLFLRKETFYNANRWFLIITLFSSIVIALFPVQYSVLVEQENNTTVFQVLNDTFNNIPVISESETIEKPFYWQQAILPIYLTGASIFLIRLLTQTFILIHLMIKYQIKSLEGVRIVENEKYGLPFSFFNVIFINPKFHKQEDLPEILAHEKVHIRENHWFDLLLIELLTVIFWFNPFIWFFERSIKQNQEYLADKAVLAQGHSTGRYQALLINQLMGMQIIGITNNLNFALNTNRLKMMTKKKTSRILGLKFVWTLPVLALLLFAFAEPSYRVKESVPGPDISTTEILAQQTIKVAGLILDETNKPMPGAAILIKGSTIGTVSDMDGKFKLDVPENSKIVISFVGKKTKEFEVISRLKEVNNTKITFLMEDAVIAIDTEIAPPPPPKLKEEKLPSSPPPPPLTSDGEEEVFFIVEDMPQYPGGHWELASFVNKMQKKIAVQKNVKGKAKVAFTVNAKGKVTDIKIVEKDNDGSGNGAYTIAKKMEDWTPGKQRGKAVPVKYLLPVEFKLR